MKKGTIAKIHDYYDSRAEYEDELIRSFKQFFNIKKRNYDLDDLRRDATEMSQDTIAEGAFNEWVVFDFKMKNGKTFVQDFYETNPLELPAYRLEVYKNLNDSKFGAFEVERVDLGQGLGLRRLSDDKKIYVKECAATYDLEPGFIISGRIGKIDEHLKLVGSNPILCMNKAPYKNLIDFLCKKNLNNKLLRDFLIKETEKFGRATKKKLFDDGRCLCAICIKKKPVSGYSMDPKTGHTLFYCENCDLEILAEEAGLDKKGTDGKYYQIAVLFIKSKVNDYFEQAGVSDGDSATVPDEVLAIIRKYWDKQFSIKQKNLFKKMPKDKLEKIFEEVPIDFKTI